MTIKECKLSNLAFFIAISKLSFRKTESENCNMNVFHLAAATKKPGNKLQFTLLSKCFLLIQEARRSMTNFDIIFYWKTYTRGKFRFQTNINEFFL